MAMLIVTLAIALPLFYLADKFHFPILNIVAGLIALLGFFIAVFVVREIVWRMEEEGTLLYRNAVVATWNGYVLKLCFIPLIGPLVERYFVKEKAKNPFVAGNEKRQ